MLDHMKNKTLFDGRVSGTTQTYGARSVDFQIYQLSAGSRGQQSASGARAGPQGRRLRPSHESHLETLITYELRSIEFATQK